MSGSLLKSCRGSGLQVLVGDADVAVAGGCNCMQVDSLVLEVVLSVLEDE